MRVLLLEYSFTIIIASIHIQGVYCCLIFKLASFPKNRILRNLFPMLNVAYSENVITANKHEQQKISVCFAIRYLANNCVDWSL